MFHKDTRRSDKFKRSVDHYKKNSQAVPTRGTKKEPENTGYPLNAYPLILLFIF